jgi:hypothetical protein
MESKQSSMIEDQGDDEEEIYFDQQTAEVLVISYHWQGSHFLPGLRS